MQAGYKLIGFNIPTFPGPDRMIAGHTERSDLDELGCLASPRGNHPSCDDLPRLFPVNRHTRTNGFDRRWPIRRGDHRSGRKALIHRPIGIVRHSIRIRLDRSPEIANHPVSIVDCLWTIERCRAI